MLPELANFSLVLALLLAVVQATVPLAGSLINKPRWMLLARPMVVGQFAFVAFAFACLTQAFLVNDFSVTYVAQHGNTLLPTIYKISAVWGAHEGSLLLWALILAAWSLAVAAISSNLPLDVRARVLSVMGMISIGFLSFMIFTSNPFERTFPVPVQGGDLNPLLQDLGLAIHPPMLYMGYVGLSVAFSFAIAALISGRLDAAWARWSRPWTTAAWVFLTLGIALGSWWAYYELGWGGWWFWDPVENASFMPWLAATALIHSLSVSEKRGAFKRWTVLLALTAFSLSLLGTFLVRSGVLTSVHAFAADPERGLFILIFLSMVIGGSLLLYAFRAPGISSGGRFSFLSRESLLLGNNVLLVVITALVLLGTLAPLLYDAMGWGKISVGFPWFNSMFVIFTPLLFILMGIGPLVRWKNQHGGELISRIRFPAVAAILIGLGAGMFVGDGSVWAGLGIGLAAWVTWSVFASLLQRLRYRRTAGAVFSDLTSQGGGSYYGMLLAHLGVAISIVGVAMVSQFEIEKDIRMSPGNETELAGYRMVFEGAKPVQGPNYQSAMGRMLVFDGDEQIATLIPEKRTYTVQRKPMTEAGIDAGFWRDVYVSLGEPLGNGDWALRVYYKPFVRWIWLGALLMGLGGFMAAMDKRYRLSRQRRLSGAEAQA